MKTAIALVAFAFACSAAHHEGIIPAGSAIYINTNNGFDMFLMAALQEKHVPLRIVSSPEKADYTLDSTIFHVQEAIAVKSTAKVGRASEAAVKLTSKSGEIVWAYAATKGIMSRGSQSVAEACAKHFKELVIK